MTFHKASCVRLARRRSRCLILAKTSSIGFRSGEYGGRNSSSAPADSISCRVRDRLWLPRLSNGDLAERNEGGTVCRKNWLGGLLSHYYRQAA